MLPLVIVEGIVIGLLTLLVAGLLRSHAEILRQLHALGVGDENNPKGGLSPRRNPHHQVAAPLISGSTPNGEHRSVSLTGSKGYTLVAFLSSGCSTCKTFWDAFAKEPELPRRDIRPVIVTAGPDRESPSEIASLAPGSVVTVMSSEAWDTFRVPGTPYFQLIDGASGMTVGEGSANSWPRLVDLIRRSLADGRLAADTSQRLIDTDTELAAAGIEPNDPILYRKPSEP